jgi:glycosyltransferase involved in cell wall biosynthesis
MHKVSIITPFRNAQAFILETANSIFSQTHSNWEWILINDHSQEEEENRLKEYLKDPRVKLVPTNGKGITDALVTGFTIATGEYVTRMDADDIMPENKLECFLDQLQKNEIDIVTGKVQYFSEDGIISPGYKKYEAWLNERVEQQDFHQEIYRECTLASGNWMMSTERLRQIDGFTGLAYPEDYDLLFRWYTNDLKIHGIDEVTHLWREHPMRTSKNSDDYGQKSFFDLKIKRYIAHDLLDIPLVLNGTGAKGRLVATVLMDNNIPFDWVSIEPEKFKGGVYGKKIVGYDSINHGGPIQILNAAAIEKEEVEKLYLGRNAVKRVVTV